MGEELGRDINLWLLNKLQNSQEIHGEVLE